MREELRDSEVVEINGGNVVMSASLNSVAFSKLKIIYPIKGDFKTMRNRLIELYDENENMEAKAFDTLVRDDFLAKGWI